MTAREPVRRTGLSRAQGWGFFALCLLGASSWLVDAQWSSALPAAALQSLHDAILAAVLLAVAGKGMLRGSLRGRPWKRLALGSVLLLGVPATLAGGASGAVSEVTITALFALAPVAMVVLVACGAFGGVAASGGSGLLPWAVAGLGGVLLLLPFEVPDSWLHAGLEAVVVLAVIVAALAAVWMHTLLRGFTLAQAACICCVANAAWFAAWLLASRSTTGLADPGATSQGMWMPWSVEAGRAIVFDLPQVLLLLWLMRDVAPERLAARYLVVPLVTVFEGYALLRPPVGVRDIVGAALIAAGAWRLLTAPTHDDQLGLTLR